ncbi:hypothetical protein D210916BOD24_12380 [Alteromonas sp. D210916BOD_24]|uniref:ATP-binding cassette domain-containing protein n=1 Tax=Alteromonas sp. D210916BOD_24 TaxID=3157618 RepID=UPI00399C8B31
MTIAISVNFKGRVEAAVTMASTSKMMGILGPSGAGKSSFLRAVAGVEDAASVSISWPNLSRRIGMVYQQAMLFPHLNVQGNLELATLRATKGAISISHAVVGCCCDHLLDKPVSTLSGGEAQRVAIARALVNGPDLLLLDESFSAIDIATRRKIYQFLKALCMNTGLKCIVVSHDIEDLALFCDELVYFAQGNTVKQGTTGDVLNDLFETTEVGDPTATLEGVIDVCSASTQNGTELREELEEAEKELGKAHEIQVVIVNVEGVNVYVTRDTLITSPLSLTQQSGRFSVKATDVSIDTCHEIDNTTSSILNALPCQIQAISPVMHGCSQLPSAKVLLTLAIQGNNKEASPQLLYASISSLSLSRLHLHVGMNVMARFKLL